MAAIAGVFCPKILVATWARFAAITGGSLLTGIHDEDDGGVDREDVRV